MELFTNPPSHSKNSKNLKIPKTRFPRIIKQSFSLYAIMHLTTICDFQPIAYKKDEKGENNGKRLMCFIILTLVWSLIKTPLITCTHSTIRVKYQITQHISV